MTLSPLLDLLSTCKFAVMQRGRRESASLVRYKGKESRNDGLDGVQVGIAVGGVKRVFKASGRHGM